MSTQEIQKLVSELVILGEDADELAYYTSVFEDLDPESQDELYQSLLEETATLQKLTTSKPGQSAPQPALP